MMFFNDEHINYKKDYRANLKNFFSTNGQRVESFKDANSLAKINSFVRRVTNNNIALVHDGKYPQASA